MMQVNHGGRGGHGDTQAGNGTTKDAKGAKGGEASQFQSARIPWKRWVIELLAMALFLAGLGLVMWVSFQKLVEKLP